MGRVGRLYGGRTGGLKGGISFEGEGRQRVPSRSQAQAFGWMGLEGILTTTLSPTRPHPASISVLSIRWETAVLSVKCQVYYIYTRIHTYMILPF